MTFGLAELALWLGVIVCYVLVAAVVIFLAYRLVRYLTRKDTGGG